MLKLSQQYPLKRAFITGAASGLGKELAKQLAQDGWKLGVCDISEERLTATVDELKAYGHTVAMFVLDVGNDMAYKVVADAFLKQFGGVDLLINNAGVGEGSLFEAYTTENWKWITGVNQMAAIYGCSFFLPAMLAQQAGYIINIASAAAFANAPTMAPYNVTKAAVLSLSETLYAETKHRGIKVSVVMPTFFRTNIDRFARGGDEHKETAHKLLATSGIEASEMAAAILCHAGRGKFYILLPAKAKFLFLVKRLFPMLFLRFTAYIASNQESLNNKLQERYGKLSDKEKTIEE
ncbi:MAG: SDR family NAD(P)-dependent oxidoreductase [Chitinophagales bacterium]|nr:SDR family NAD(P)-dependent oxidoreductase [Chitinophagales bacterium]